MKNFILNTILTAIIITCGFYAINLTGKIALGLMFISGFTFGILLMNLKLFVKNNKINSYKRELEKKSVISDENSAKVKILENKIIVLEKALENALHK